MIAKIKKLLLIILLTLLIWVWADISGEVELNNQTASIVVSPTISRDLWLSLETRPGLDPKSQAVSVVLELTGPRARIEEFKREYLPLEVEFSPDIAQNYDQENNNTSVPIEEYVQNDPVIRKLGLNVVSVTPKAINVKVERLVKKQLKVVCVDADTNLIDGAKTTPAIIEMSVKEIWAGEKLNAYVKLTPSQIEEAQQGLLELNPYVELDPRRIRYAESAVQVTIPPTSEQKMSDAISGPIIGFVFNFEMLNKYRVEITDAPKVVEYRATLESSKAFKSQKYHMLLDISLEDAPITKGGEEKSVTRKLRYNFQQEHVRLGQISAPETQIPTITFKLIPIKTN